MTFQDIFKSNFINNISSINLFDMVLALVLAFGIGVFIFFIYKHVDYNIVYSGSFGVSLIGITMITTLVILAVTSNIVLSLGMVGALSIVRFRTAIKEPLDLTFLFWAVAVGIVLAAGLIPLAIFGSLIVGAMILVFCNKKSYISPYMLIVTCKNSEEVEKFISDKVNKYVIKSKIVESGTIELSIDIRLKSKDTSFIEELAKLENVNNVALVSYNGEYLG